LILITLGLTLLTLFYKAEESWIGNLPSDIVARGFPLHFVESSEYISRFLSFPFILNLTFWSMATFSTWFVLFSTESKKKYLLAKAIVLGFVLMGVGMNGTSCDGGFTVVFYSRCGEGVSSLYWVTYGVIFDTLFWFVIGTITVASLHFFTRFGSISKHVMIPIFLTALSFIYERGCGGFFCFFDGRGFPLPYYDDEFIWQAFLIDIPLWIVIYIITRNLILLYRKLTI